MAAPLVEALTATSHTFAAVGDTFDFGVRATDPDSGPGSSVSHTLRFYVEDQAGTRTPINFVAEVTTPGAAETVTWLEPQAGDIPAGFTAALVASAPGNPATATYRVTRVS